VSKLYVQILREPWSEFFDLVLADSGHSEQLEPDEARAWFKERNADMTVVESALDRAWNFGSASVTIHEHREPVLSRITNQPNV